MKKKISDHAAAAKAIRQELKKNGIKGRVNASSYAGGSSVRVVINDELPATVEAVKEFAYNFQYGHFDGMNDIYEYSNTNGDIPQVRFVFVENRFSDETRAAAWAYILATYAGFDNAPESVDDAWEFYCEDMRQQGVGVLNMILNGNDGDFWNSRKPRVRLAA